MTKSLWVSTTPRLKPGVCMRLFCLPHAGGGAAAFRGWQAGVPRSIEVCPVRLPGREMRLHEPAITSLPDMLAALSAALEPYAGEPYALFGHSMGALLAHEVMVRLAELGRPLPAHLFVAGRPAPQVTRNALSRPVEQLSDDDLMREVTAINAASRAAFGNAELAAVMLPVLRADFAMCQDYRALRRPPFPVPLAALGGLSDPCVTRAELEPWREHTTRAFSLHMFPGDHLFVSSAAPHVQRLVGEKLASAVSVGPQGEEKRDAAETGREGSEGP
jgi:surfactin synthase thioesterase subunit